MSAQCFKCLKDELGKGKGRFAYYSATGLMPAAQRRLTNDWTSSERCGRPLHLFCNIPGRLQLAVITELKAIERGRMFGYKQAQAEFKIGAMEKTELRNVADKQGQLMVEEMIAILRAVEFNRKDHCLFHSRECPISPCEY